MKKLSLILGMVLAVGMVMAQMTTVAHQFGIGNLANVTQSASATIVETATINAVQLGSWNVLNTSQTGLMNYIDLNQGGANNTANMTQMSHDAAFVGGNNTADILQTGNNGKANLVQGEPALGSGADVSTNTARAKQYGQNNTYNASQGARYNVPTNVSTLEQGGLGNLAGITQKGRKNTSNIAQGGNWNKAYLDQGNDTYINTPPSMIPFGSSYSSQTGTNGIVGVNQHGNPGLQYANSIQNGTANTTNIKQLSDRTQLVEFVQSGTDIINVTQVVY